MPIYEESGLRIELPDGDSFRFQDCSGYKSLSGKNLSEMDFGWWDSAKNILWLLDVKDYSHLTKRERMPEYLLENLIRNSRVRSLWERTLLLPFSPSPFTGRGQGGGVPLLSPLTQPKPFR
jgi:hypothetical protein